MKPVFLDSSGVFSLKMAENVSALYLPLASEKGLKSAVSPNLGGDSKLDQESFLLEPVSVENLHNNRSSRNFWCITEDGCWSATGASAEQEALRFTDVQDESEVTAGFMWQTVKRSSASYGLKAAVTSFIPVDENVEIMAVHITNTQEAEKHLRMVAAIPIYARSADNLRDHRDVTAMLHRIRVTENGVVVKPTMSFDEKGHRENRRSYFVSAFAGDGSKPESFFPTVEAFLGEGGSFIHPRAVYEYRAGMPAGTVLAGKEAMGGMVFSQIQLQAGQSVDYVVLLGLADCEDEIDRVQERFSTVEQIEYAFAQTRAYWQNKVNVCFHTGDADTDALLRWVCFQPLLRRIFGCSFLPHHDYGRGGRGWRDLWQDCLSLLLMEPTDVHDMITANFGGVRMDGTNATIVGAGLGNFIADRNGIARVWMDHAMWPLMTVRLYIDQTGDLEILDEQAGYFKDPQTQRGTAIDALWKPEQGSRQFDAGGKLYEGSILEHLLIEHLTAFYEVGEHNVLRLRGADWNDALDMASSRGESVAFSFAYAGNLRELSALLRQLAKRTRREMRLFCEELKLLLGGTNALYENVEEKTALLARYTALCAHSVSGRKINLSLYALADELDAMAEWMMAHLRRQEWLDEGWFNSYYDDHGRRVEGSFPEGVRMMLTGQVFAIMSGTATQQQVRSITENADRWLFDGKHGGYRLNTDFQELKSDMGRMFGFAYGEKENGAVFSHMSAMYANALYRRGFVREGYKALRSLMDAALDFETSHIYPNIPEYFSLDGRGRYSYLTGAGSWMMLTMMTEVFGVRGELGDLVIAPKLVEDQFDAAGQAGINFRFDGKAFMVTFRQGATLDCISGAWLSNAELEAVKQLSVEDGRVRIPRSDLMALPESGNRILVELQ